MKENPSEDWKLSTLIKLTITQRGRMLAVR